MGQINNFFKQKEILNVWIMLIRWSKIRTWCRELNWWTPSSLRAVMFWSRDLKFKRLRTVTATGTRLLQFSCSFFLIYKWARGLGGGLLPWRKPFHYDSSSSNRHLKAACAKDAFVSSYFIDSPACTTFTCHRLKREQSSVNWTSCTRWLCPFYSTAAVIFSFTALYSSHKDVIISESTDIC